MPTSYSSTYNNEDFSGNRRDDIFNGTFTNCGFRGADLRKATLSGTFYYCDFRGANLPGVDKKSERFKSCKW